jgi:tetratricopeptide (TPR) repeat protein
MRSSLSVRGVECVVSIALALAVPVEASAARSALRSKQIAASQPAPARSVEDFRREARRLADQGRHDEALAVVKGALREHPDNTDLLWLEAGIMGEASRHRESVALYEKLVAQHPELANDTRLDLGTQRLWAGDAAGALRDIELWLSHHPNDVEARRVRAIALSHADRLHDAADAYDQLLAANPGDLEMRLERARILGWMGNHKEASAAYREILRRHPGNPQAELGLAQNENWGGNHRRAVALFEDMIARGRKDAEVYKGLAYAHYWSGRPDRSRAALDRLLAVTPNDPEADELALLLAREEGPATTTSYEWSEDSDDLRIASTMLEVRRPLGERAALMLRLRRDDVRDPGGDRDPMQIGLGHRSTWSNHWASELFLHYLEPGEERPGLGLGEGTLSFRPSDRARFNLGAAKELLLTRLALERGILTRTYLLGFESLATDRVGFELSQRVYHFSDENRATRRSALGRALLITRLRTRLAATFDVQHLKTHLDLDNGYYDPERYVEFGPGLELEWKPAEAWGFEAKTRTGWQEEKNSSREPYFGIVASGEAPLGRSFALGLEVERSNSNLSTASGFEQVRWAAYLIGRF